MLVRLEELKATQVAEVLRSHIPVIPTGSTEQHCTLPLGTDSIIVERLVDLACHRLSNRGVGCLILPPLRYGYSVEWSTYPGTVTLSSRTLESLVLDILESVSRWGAERVAIVNGHGGNSGVLEAAARKAAVKTGLIVGVTDYWAHAEGVAIGHASRVEELLLSYLSGFKPGKRDRDEGCDEGVLTGRGVKILSFPRSSAGGAVVYEGGVGAYTGEPERLVDSIVSGLAEFLYRLWTHPKSRLST